MAISKFQNFEFFTPKNSKNRYFWENLYKIQKNLKFEKTGIYIIEPYVYYLYAKF